MRIGRHGQSCGEARAVGGCDFERLGGGATGYRRKRQVRRDVRWASVEFEAHRDSSRATYTRRVPARIATGHPASADQTSSGTIPSTHPSVAEKRKPKGKCKKKQVRVTVNKRTRCRKLGAALPRPREGDDRLLLAQFGLADDLGGLRDSRGRRPPSLKQLFQDINPQAYDTLLSGIRRSLGRIDELAAARPKAFPRLAWPGYLAAPLDRHIPDCARGDPPTQSDSFTSTGSGGTGTPTMTLGREMGLGLGLPSGGYSLQPPLTAGRWGRVVAPACPTAHHLMN